ncbi:MAG: GNAT family N-acetyltransferase, partial [Burkholderia gladioli]
MLELTKRLADAVVSISLFEACRASGLGALLKDRAGAPSRAAQLTWLATRCGIDEALLDAVLQALREAGWIEAIEDGRRVPSAAFERVEPWSEAAAAGLDRDWAALLRERDGRQLRHWLEQGAAAGESLGALQAEALDAAAMAPLLFELARLDDAAWLRGRDVASLSPANAALLRADFLRRGWSLDDAAGLSPSAQGLAMLRHAAALGPLLFLARRAAEAGARTLASAVALHRANLRWRNALDDAIAEAGVDADDAWPTRACVMAAAAIGCLPERPGPAQPAVEPGPARFALHAWTARPYRVRHPSLDDLAILRELDLASWPAGMAVPESELRRRIEQFPQGQLLIEQDGQVIASLYTQRIETLDQLRHTPYARFAGIHHPRGALAHLMGICVAPDRQGHGLADQLIDFGLVYLASCEGIDSVAAVTRCHEYGRVGGKVPLDDYIQQRDDEGRYREPMLQFHASHGATIHEVVPGFRPEDQANHGTGVLIEYARYRQAAEAAEHVAAVEPVLPVRAAAAADVAEAVRASILDVLGEPRAAAYGPQVPLMEMGFSSFHLQELRRGLGERVGLKLDATFFFQHGTPAAIVKHLRERLAPAGSEPDPVRPPADTETPRRSTADDDSDASERIAVIGVACRFPGGVGNPEQFWRLLENGVDAIGERGPGLSPGAASTRRGGFIDEVDRFDAGFFRISPREAELVDPQHRLLLEVVWEALEQAGIAPGRLAGSDTGVFVGVMGHDYERLLRQQGSAQPIDPYFATGNANSIAAGRIAYYYDWHGPTLAVDTACSSSLVATHLACESLLAGECGLALAGGVNLLLHEDMFAAFEQAGMLSPEARCKTFDASADGYVRGEGCAVLVLKRLSQARRDGDPVWAVIRGSAINQDGASAGLTAPNQGAQQAVIEAALRKGGVAPHALRYLEAHGTGTRLGDPIEVLAASAALGAGRPAGQPLLLGSVKTNIGHLEAAAGVAGLIKVMLSMRHGLIPRHLHLRQPNPHLDWAALPVEVVGEARPWPAGPKLAGVSSFGFSGTNAHVVLEAYPAEPANAAPKAARSSALLLLSAKRPELLQAQARQLHEALGALGEADLPDVAYTLQVGRDAMEYRLAL